MHQTLQEMTIGLNGTAKRLNAALIGVALMLAIALGATLSSDLGKISAAAGLQSNVPLLIGP